MWPSTARRVDLKGHQIGTLQVLRLATPKEREARRAKGFTGAVWWVCCTACGWKGAVGTNRLLDRKSPPRSCGCLKFGRRVSMQTPPRGARWLALPRGRFALVSTTDFAAVGCYLWFLDSSGYAMRQPRVGAKLGPRTLLHNWIYQRAFGRIPAGLEVDHKNRDRLDCRRTNLRVCSRGENLANRTKARRNTTGFKGVYRDTSKDGKVRWKAIVTRSFESAEEAARAFDRAAVAMWGEFVQTNFLRRKEKANGYSYA